MENIEPIQELEDYSFIFVMGVAHSGTTILYRLLARHPNLCWFSQFSQRTGGVPGRIIFPFASLFNNYGRKIFGTPWKKKKDLSLYFIPRPMEAHKIWDYLLPEELVEKEDLSEQGVEDMKDRFQQVFNSELSSWGKQTNISKLPRLLSATELLCNLLPNTKIIHLTRDGRAVSLSNIDKFGGEGSVRKLKLKLSAKHWKERVGYMNQVKDSIGSDDFMEIKLETLQKDFESEFKSILNFLDLDYESYPKPLPELRKNTNKKYKEKVSEEDVDFLEDLLKEELGELNYNSSWKNI